MIEKNKKQLSKADEIVHLELVEKVTNKSKKYIGAVDEKLDLMFEKNEWDKNHPDYIEKQNEFIDLAQKINKEQIRILKKVKEKFKEYDTPILDNGILYFEEENKQWETEIIVYVPPKKIPQYNEGVRTAHPYVPRKPKVKKERPHPDLKIFTFEEEQQISENFKKELENPNEELLEIINGIINV